MTKFRKALLVLSIILDVIIIGLTVTLYVVYNNYWKVCGEILGSLSRDFADKTDAIHDRLEKIEGENVALNELLSRIDPDMDGVLGDDDLCPLEEAIKKNRSDTYDGDLDRNGCNDGTYWMEPDVAFERYQVEDEDGNVIPWPKPQPTTRGYREDDGFLWWYWDNVRRTDGKEIQSFGLQCRAMRGDDEVTLGEMATAPSTSYGHCAVYEGEPDLVPDKYLPPSLRK